ncbi:MAG: hypothetical protein ABWZ58_00415 [Acidimicrobiia bacterium]
MDHRIELTERDLSPQLRRVSLLFLLAGVLFLGLILNPLIIGYFDAARPYDEGLAFVRDHLTALRWVFTGIGLVDLLLGASLWLWGNQVRKTVSGGQATAATVAAWAGLWGGVAGLAGRLRLAWFRSVEDLVFTGGMRFDVWEFVFLTAMLAATTAFVIFGILMIRGSMPTWLGIVLIACGFLPYVGFLPMWYYVGAIVLGITNLVRFRETSSTATGRQPTTTV